LGRLELSASPRRNDRYLRIPAGWSRRNRPFVADYDSRLTRDRLWDGDIGNTLEVRLCKSLDDAIYSARGATCSQRTQRALSGKERAA
jgi:hypothetical protein